MHTIPSSFAERFRHWYRFERDRDQRSIEMLRTVPQEARGTAPFDRAVGRMAHILAARHVWLHRLGAAADRPADMFPNALLEDLPAMAAHVEDLWSAYLDGVTDDDMAMEFTYSASDGKSYRWRLIDLLTQLFGHAWFHRGQITMAVRDLGGEPVDTDYIFWDRPTPIDTPSSP